MSQDRRAFRFAFSAAAEVAAESSPNATVSVRATELSLHGCYLQMLAPFAVGIPILVKIFYAGEYFEAKGVVTHVEPALGMGLTFREINPYCRSILQKWILAALHHQTNAEN